MTMEGDAFCFVAGEKWHSRRKLLTPTFHSGLLEVYLKTAIREGDILISCLRKEVGKPAFDIVPYAKRATLDIICGKSNEFLIAKVVGIDHEHITREVCAFSFRLS